MGNFKDFNLDLKKIKCNKDVLVASKKFTSIALCVPSFACTLRI